MTEKETIKILQELSLECCEAFGFDCGNCDKCGVTIAYDTAIKALEKQIPKDVLEEAVAWFDLCPECHKAISRRYEDGIRYIDYCPFCGQALDWSNEK